MVDFVHLSREDMLRKVEPLLRNGYFIREEDGKIDCVRKLNWETPWVHVKHGNKDCHYLHRVLFEHIFERKLVPSACQECWKVVVSPKTVKGLVAMLELLRKLDKPSKCGMEVFRRNTPNRYGAYVYNDSLEEGRACYKIVRRMVDEHPDLGSETKVILKRGCTEFEQAVGPSDKWRVTEEQREMERIAEEIFVVRKGEELQTCQPYHLITHVMREWLIAAWQIGDESYLHFTGGEPMFKPVVTYHEGGQNG